MSPPSSLVLATSATQPGGVWRHVCDLAAGARDAGLPVLIAGEPEARGLAESAQDLGVQFATLDDALSDRTSLWHVHLHDTFETAWLARVLRRSTRRAGTIVTEHLPRSDAADPSLPPEHRTPGSFALRTAFKRVELAAATATIAVSAASAAFMGRRYRLRDGALRVIPNGVTPSRDPAAPPAGEPLRIVVVGSLIVQKGIDVLVEACARMAGDLRADVLGDGPHRGALEQRAQELGAPVTFHERQPDVAHWLGDAHALCVPSRWESLPYAALDAMALGRPVLATKVDGLGDLVEDGVSGRLVPPDDPGALADVLEEWAQRPESLVPMGLAARERVTRSYSLDEMVGRTLAVYDEAGLR